MVFYSDYKHKFLKTETLNFEEMQNLGKTGFISHHRVNMAVIFETLFS